ncbi:MAG: hypothetical protein M1820_008262 [Bogoriella megaspora]|nr:MAG: hypothetical protein M1820_008262 [Bogoriella megaspora]
MADPLSISASVVALVTAVNAARKGLAKLLALHKAPGELTLVLNEITEVQRIISAYRGIVDSSETCENEGRLSGVENVRKSISDCKDAVLALEHFVHYKLLLDIALDNRGNLKPSKRTWLLRSKELLSLQQDLTERRKQMMEALILFQAQQQS